MNRGFFQHDPESKPQSMHWKSPSSPSHKKARQNKSKSKAMVIVFSTSEGLFTWTVCLKVRSLTRSTTRRFWQTFVKGWEEEDPKCGKMAHGFFTKTTRRHKTPCLSSLFDETQDHRVATSTVLTWPSPMRLFLFPKIKSALKGTRFESINSVKAK